MYLRCLNCNVPTWVDGNRAEDLLRELVELKRMKDSGGIISHQDQCRYNNRKAIVWRESFKLLGVVGEPKP